MERKFEPSAEAKKRFAEMSPENYKKELRRLSRKTAESQFLYALVFFFGAITPLFTLGIASTSGGLAIIWAFIMVYSVVKAFRRIEKPLILMEVRELILQARLKNAPAEWPKNKENTDG